MQNYRRRQLLKGFGASLGAGLLAPASLATAAAQSDRILVAVELSGGNDGLNSIVPYADDAYYQARPTLGLKPNTLLKMDDHFAMNPGMLGLHKLWQRGQLAVVHGCGYDQPSYSHFTSMAYLHSGVPHRGDEFGWMGRLADAMAPSRQDNMLINVAATQSLAVTSRVHTPVVFDDPSRFQRDRWQAELLTQRHAPAAFENANHQFLHAVDQSAARSAASVRAAWSAYQTPVDYGIAPIDLPKVAACIAAGLPTQLYYVSFRNNAFDTHVAQPNLHRRLLSYASDGIYGFIQDLDRLGLTNRVLVMVFSEFGRRVGENANQGSDHGTANVMMFAGGGVNGGHYGKPPSLTDLKDDNLVHTTDFRRVYATAIEGWLGVPAAQVLHDNFAPLPVFA